MTTHRGHLLDRSRRCAETFARIGDRIEREWARFDYDDAVLPQLAADTLAECAPQRSTNGDDIVAWALSQHQLGAQPNAGSAFGQPPITVYSGRRFYIETLTGSTAPPAFTSTALRAHSAYSRAAVFTRRMRSMPRSHSRRGCAWAIFGSCSRIS